MLFRSTNCLGIFDEQVKSFRNALPAGQFAASMQGKSEIPKFKIPQIGWNSISNLKSPLFDNVPANSYCYFVHGYFAALGDHTIAVTDYIMPYSAALHRDNFYGVQFHPEKSAAVGEQILKNFIEKI